MNSTPVLIPSASMLNVPLQARTADAHLVSLREHFDRLKALEAMIEAQTVQFERNPVDGTRAYLFCSDLVTACVGNSLGPSDDADAVNASRGAMTYDDCCALFYEAHPYLNGPVDEDIIVDWCWPDVPEIERAIDDLYEKLEAFQDSFAGVYGPALSRLHETVGEIGDCVLVVALRVGSLTFEERLLTIFTGAVARGPQLAVVEVCSATAEYLCVERGGVILGQVAMKSEFQGMFAPLVAESIDAGCPLDEACNAALKVNEAEQTIARRVADLEQERAEQADALNCAVARMYGIDAELSFLAFAAGEEDFLDED